MGGLFVGGGGGGGCKGYVCPTCQIIGGLGPPLLTLMIDSAKGFYTSV